MNFKTTYILFGTLLALLAAAAVSLFFGSNPGAEGLLLANWKNADVQAKDVTKITIERTTPAEAKQVFIRLGSDKWKLEEPYAATVDGSVVERMLEGLLSAKKETKGADLTSNTAQFGLDNPSMTVTLTAGDRVTKVALGRVGVGATGGTSLVYALAPDAPKTPTAVRASDLSGLLKDADKAKVAGDAFKPVGDYRSKDLLLDRCFNPAEIVKTIKIKDAKAELALSKTAAGVWQYDAPKGFGEADVEGDTTGTSLDGPATGVKPMFTAVTNLRAQGEDDFVENVTDFKQYGLERGKEDGFVVSIARKNPTPDSPDIAETLAVGKKDDKDGKFYARLNDEAGVVKLSAASVDAIKKLLEKPGALRERSLVTANASSADGIDVQIGGDAPLEFRKVGDHWRLFDKDGKSVDASKTEVDALLNAVGGKRNVKEFPDSAATDATLGLDRPSAVVTLWIGGIIPEEKTPEEKKDDKAKAEEKKPEPAKDAKPKMKEPTVKLVFGKRDKDLLYVQRQAGGTKTNLAVADAMLAKVTRGRLDYLDTILPSFVANDATKLTFNRGGETFVLEKKKVDDKTPESWTIVQPANLAGRAADGFKVAQLLADLSGVKAQKLWAEKATDAELDRWGLKSPKLKVVVTLKGEKPEERTYLFGGDADGGVYAKHGERDLVFSASKGILDDFATLDVVDPTIIRVDPNKVTGMKLTGWKDTTGEEQVLDMERKAPNNWAMKGESKFKLSGPAADGFLGAVTLVRAEKFVAYKTGPKPEYKLTPAAGALAVELTLDGEKEPVTLMLGAEVDGKSYYATSNKAPGDVFLVAKDRFEKYKAKRAAFSAD